MFDLPTINLSGYQNHAQFPRVLPSEVEQGQRAAEHLIRAGYKSLIGLSHWWGAAHSRKRIEGFKKGVARMGMESSTKIILNKPANLEKIFKDSPTPCGLFVTEPALARNLFNYMEKENLNVPEEFGLICVDRKSSWNFWSPKQTVTYIAPPWNQIGYKAADLMANWVLMGVRPPMITLCPPGNVTEQASTRRTTLNYTLSQRLENWLEYEYNPAWGVQELAVRLECSVSSLYQHSQRLFGQGLKEELLERRHRHCCEVLRNSQISVSELASQCGFSHPSSFILAFKKKEGLTPREYRLGPSKSSGTVIES